MKKKVLVFLVVTILLVGISGTLGYVAGYYVQGLQEVNDMNVRTHCHVLLLESLRFARKVDSSGMTGLIDAVELNCEGWASFIRVWQPYSSATTMKEIEEALQAWEKAKGKLEELRTLYVEQKPPDVG